MSILMTTHPIKTKINKDATLRYLSGEMRLNEIEDFAKKFTNRITYIVHETLLVFNDRMISAKLDYGEKAPPSFSTDNSLKTSQALYFKEISNFIPVDIQVISRNSEFVENPLYKNIPVHWLYEDFEEQLQLLKDKLYQQKKDDEEQLIIKTKHIKSIQENIRSKLTPEELEVIFFKMPSEINFK